MPSASYAIESGGAKRLLLRWGFFWKNFVVLFDGAEVGRVEGGASALRSGADVPLPNGSTLRVQLVRGFASPPLELHVDGRPVPGSLAVPLPKWSYFFLAACVLIPIVTMGGALPAALGFGGAAGVASIARDESKASTLRMALALGITVLCWGAVGALALAVGAASGG